MHDESTDAGAPREPVPYDPYRADHDESLASDPAGDFHEPATVRSRPRWPGTVSFVLAVASAVLVAAGVVMASAGGFLVATIVSFVAIVLSAVALVLGMVAVIGRFGRGAGALGAVLAIVANPLVQVGVLTALGG